jgi:hypothetical protein
VGGVGTELVRWLELEMDMLGTRLMEGGKAALPPVCAGSSIATYLHFSKVSTCFKMFFNIISNTMAEIIVFSYSIV